jgi:hypothetical protein
MSILLAALVAAAPVGCGPAAPAPAAPADSLEALYRGGRTFAEFLAAARARREMWRSNYAWGRADPELLARARALGGGWRLLVIADDSCGDSANTIPYLATFIDSLGGGLDMRIIPSREGRAVQESHRTWDGRAATPTVLLLDAEGREAGCWVERPRPLAVRAREYRASLPYDDYVARVYAWYDEDRGRETIRDILDMIEDAGSGRPCLGNT